MARPLAVVGLTWLVVLAVLFALPQTVALVAALLFALGAGVLLVLPKRNETVRCALLVCVAGAVACLLLLAQLQLRYAPAMAAVGEKLPIRAVITSNAEHRFGRYYYEATTRSVGARALRVRVRISSPTPLYCQPYDEVEYVGVLKPLGDDDPELLQSYKAQGRYLASYAQSFGEDRYVVRATHTWHPMRWVLRLREHIDLVLQERLPPEDAALLRAMLLGDKSGLSWHTLAQFRRVGISHIFAVSGLHVSLLAWGFLGLLRSFGFKDRTGAGATMAFVLVFMALTGFSSSCVRAGVMLLVLLGGRLVHRRADSLNSLGAAAMVLLVASPLSAGQVGLQLSFGATLGIVWFAPKLQAGLAKLPGALGKLGNPLGVSLAAMALTLPLQLLRFVGGVSALAPLANLCFVPVSGALLSMGAFAVLLDGLPVLQTPILCWVGTCAAVLRGGVNGLSQWSVPWVRAEVLPAAVPIALCLLLAAVALFCVWRGAKLRLPPVAACLCVVFLCGTVVPSLLLRSPFLGAPSTQVRLLPAEEGVLCLLVQGSQAALLGCSSDAMAARTVQQALDAVGALALECLVVAPGDTAEATLRRQVPAKRLLRAEDCPGEWLVPLWPGANVLVRGAQCYLYLNDAVYCVF